MYKKSPLSKNNCEVIFMSDDNKTPMEFPATQQEKRVDPIVDVVEKELNPPHNTSVQQTTSKSQQE